MIIKSNMHAHTTWCDGADTPSAMAQAAYELGFEGLGFSGHSPTPFDPTCPGISSEAGYRADIEALKAEYAGRMSILCGVEEDLFATVSQDAYDYRIGSVHYIKDAAGNYIAVDGDRPQVQKLLKETFAGNGLALARTFYESTVLNVQTNRPDIVGHFDLLVKHNASGILFDENSSAYRDIALQALDAVADELLAYGGILELNTGGMARGYRQTPYPANFLLRHAAQRGVRVMINSDSHSVKTIDYAFDTALECIKTAGFASLVVLRQGKFIEVKL